MDIIDENSRNMRLWAAVTIQSVKDLCYDNIDESDLKYARQWIKNPDNLFFNYMATGIDFDPAKLRENIFAFIESHKGEKISFTFLKNML